MKAKFVERRNNGRGTLYKHVHMEFHQMTVTLTPMTMKSDDISMK